MYGMGEAKGPLSSSEGLLTGPTY